MQAFVEMLRFELKLEEPKSSVLPLHHTSIGTRDGTRTRTGIAAQGIFMG